MSIVGLAGRALGVAERAPRRRAQRVDLNCEPLEHRRLFSADATVASLSGITAHTNLSVVSAVSTGPTGLTPAQIRAAYGINLIAFSGGAISGTGAGETIAIVDAYNDPTIAADLAAFDQEFGLAAPPSFTVDNLGATTTDAGWALETSLDVEWAHAIAPAANIVLVEAASSSLSSLFGAVSFAGKQAGVTVVSMSWGTSEFFGESNYNSVFTTPAGHANVTYVAASGDTGAYSGPEYPSVSPNVLAVGGTTLTLNASGTYGSESGWSGSTGGFSGTDSDFTVYQSEPSYQTSTLASAGLSYGVRTTPDVSFNADPSSGVSVYDSVGYGGQAGWFDLGGTSAAAPAWAGLIAVADQGLATGGRGSLTTSQVLTDLYSLPSSDFNDITTGFNGYNATAGYDLVTGLGTPKANLLVAGVLAANGVSENTTTTAAAGITSTSMSTTTTASTSPHKAKSKHTKVVIQKTHKARKADLVSSPSDGSTVSASGSASITSPHNSGPGLLLTATSSVVAQDVAALSSPASKVPIRGTDAQNASSTDSTATALAPANQCLANDPRFVTSFQSLESGDSDLNVHPTLIFKEQGLMNKPAIVTYEPEFSPATKVSVQGLLDPAKNDFDEALEQVACSLPRKCFRKVRPQGEYAAETESTDSRSEMATVVGTGAIAAAAYRFVLRPPNDPERHPWWCSRFPRS